VLYIWEGGIAIYGGVLGAIVGMIVFCRIKKISLGATLDLVLMGFLIGQAIGRWGNFFNREAFGAETESFLRMGLLNALTGEITYHHPTFLYESAWNALGFVVLHFLSKKREFDGQIALGYAFWYGLGRFFIEGLRTDSLYIPGTALRVSQLLAALSCLAAAAVLVYFILKPPAKRLFVDRVAENTTEPDEGGNEDA
jgi:phosphatidylglycerol:prolipoprotein diacylglycerol transferase